MFACGWNKEYGIFGHFSPKCYPLNFECLGKITIQKRTYKKWQISINDMLISKTKAE